MFINDSSVNKNIGKRIDSIKPYKRSEFARNLVRNLSDYSTSAPVTPRFSKGIKREIQESEFPTDIDIEKVLEDHINQEREKQILKAVKPILHENLSFCFHLLKEFSIMKLIHKKTLAATLVPTSIEKILNRFEISYKSHAFQNIRISAEYKKTLIKLSENKQKSACKNLVKSIGD